LRSKGVRQLRTLPNEEISGAQEHSRRLLLNVLDRNKTHGRPRYRLANRFGIGGVSLTALDVGLPIDRRNDAHVVTTGANLPRPGMRSCTGFEPNQARRQAAEEVEDLRTAPCAPDHDGAFAIDNRAPGALI
jgi:hypothetical protein